VLLDLDALLDQERAALETSQYMVVPRLTSEKARLLLELTQLQPSDEATIAVARGVRKKLETNLFLLNMHLTAFREVTAAVSSALNESESDGTYGYRAFRSTGAAQR
jgi:flagellar biosynthesis/type III secretory pathway chaperone